FMLDFIEAENSMGFHAGQEAGRILGKSIDFARRGQASLTGGTLQVNDPPRAKPTVAKPTAQNNKANGNSSKR
ncbi:MAG TPA: ammonia-forming cytochrome c nitrite reductase subunit c552, partial [Candidatus Kapabacteria bacterium]|nr:ammonia-forming cytochrome c nitrite reductase subunit c552 [Candidatus Kapabacteria bacterium]